MPTQAVLITGGAQGIGRGVARRFLQGGWRVILFDVDAEALAETRQDLAGLGEVMTIAGDVGSEDDIRRAGAGVRSEIGRLDALVNNAGIGINRPLADLTLEQWNRVLAVNLTGAFLCSRELAPLLREARGAIVNIASTRALQSEANTEAYAASKGGLVALTHALAVSLGPAVRVNCICPGWIDTSTLQKRSRRQAAVLSAADHAQHPCGRVGTPDDIAAMVWYLAREEAGFVTGAHFVLDGGMTHKMIYV
jgi:NAD(P)-dependent dehydrogenase (short-subunit alcohol dehydrogenase family)